jgi:hypothetical protein
MKDLYEVFTTGSSYGWYKAQKFDGEGCYQYEKTDPLDGLRVFNVEAEIAQLAKSLADDYVTNAKLGKKLGIKK